MINPYMGNAKEPEPGTFGWKLRQRRLEVGLTQTRLAERCGWRPNYISRYELNVVAPVDPARQAKLDAALELAPGTIGSWLPRRVSRQQRRVDDGVRVVLDLERLTDEEKQTLLHLVERMSDDRATGLG